MRQVVDNDRAHIVLSRSYSPFGKLLGEDGDVAAGFGFAGEQTDPNDLIFLRARYYDVQTGRFVSKDPFPGTTPLPQSLHPYTYCLNDPINCTDPSGALPPLIAYPAGVLVQFFNDMNLGGVSAGYTALTGKTLDDIHNRAFQVGRRLGRDISEALAWFEVLGGGALMGTSLGFAPLAAAAAAGAPLTGGLSLIPAVIDAGAFAAGVIVAGHGAVRLVYNRCNPLPAPHVSYSTGSGSGTGGGSSSGSSSWQHPNARKARQAVRRGWTHTDIQDVLEHPAQTRRNVNKATGNPATYYYRADGYYVVRDDITLDVFHVSDRFDPGWIDPNTNAPISPTGGP